MSTHPLRIFAGSSHPGLALEVINILKVPLGKSTTRIFDDSETYVTIDEAVRDQDIFLIQTCSTPVNDHLMELLLYLDAFRRASAHSISLVVPYFPYARQDRMARGREAISGRVVANLLECEGAARVIFFDIHNPAIQGFFNIPVDPLSAITLLANYYRKPEYRNAAIVSPDVGRASLASKYAGLLDLPLVIMHKKRSSPSEVKTTHIVGDITGRRPIIVDDLIASGSVLNQLDDLYQHGAEGKACLAITHPVLLASALKRLDEDDRIEKLVVTNTIPLPSEKLNPKIEVLSIAPMLSDVIYRIHEGISISDKFIMK
jgi:ribose-phosphate pyrophosphokinase